MFGFFENKANELWSVMAPEKSDGEKCFAAVEAGRLNDVKMWLNERAISPNLKNEAGNTLIHVAAYNGQEAVVHLLVEAGADIRALGARHNTCLHFASSKGHQNLVNYFIQQGLSVSQKNANGQNAYDVANGFAIKQQLMQLIFKEEEANGTAPVILGASKDKTEQEERLRNLPPPPKMGETFPTANNTQQAQAQAQAQVSLPVPVSTPASAPASTPAPSGTSSFTAAPPTPPPNAATPPTGTPHDPNYRPSGYVSRRAIAENDGFVTTVGNPELAAKYGNHSTFRAGPSSTAESQKPKSSAPIAAPTYSARSNSPFTKSRYVAYDAVTNKTVARPQAVGSTGSPYQPPVRPQGLAAQFSGASTGNIKMFNPAEHQAAQPQTPTPAPETRNEQAQPAANTPVMPAARKPMNPPLISRPITPPGVSRPVTPPMARVVTPPKIPRSVTPPNAARPITPPTVASNQASNNQSNSEEYTQEC